jgi:hypothetical protein
VFEGPVHRTGKRPIHNPYYKPDEGSPDPSSGSVSKVVATIDMSLSINGQDLSDLPKEMDWVQSIGIQNIWFEKDKFDPSILSSNTAKSLS